MNPILLKMAELSACTAVALGLFAGYVNLVEPALEDVARHIHAAQAAKSL